MLLKVDTIGKRGQYQCQTNLTMTPCYAPARQVAQLSLKSHASNLISNLCVQAKELPTVGKEIYAYEAPSHLSVEHVALQIWAGTPLKALQLHDTHVLV